MFPYPRGCGTPDPNSRTPLSEAITLPWMIEPLVVSTTSARSWAQPNSASALRMQRNFEQPRTANVVMIVTEFRLVNREAQRTEWNGQRQRFDRFHAGGRDELALRCAMELESMTPLLSLFNAARRLRPW